MTAIYVERGPRGKWRSLPEPDYLRLLAEQGGHCALCPSTPKNRRLHADHDHRDGFVRGLLCHRCNRALAAWVTPKWLYAAAAYLQRQALAGSDAPPTLSERPTPMTEDEFCLTRATDWRIPATRDAYAKYLAAFNAAQPSERET